MKETRYKIEIYVPEGRRDFFCSRMDEMGEIMLPPIELKGLEILRFDINKGGDKDIFLEKLKGSEFTYGVYPLR